MLAGEGQYHETAQQLDFDSAAYAQINVADYIRLCSITGPSHPQRGVVSAKKTK